MDEDVTTDVIEDVARGVTNEVVEYVFENVLGDVSFIKPGKNSIFFEKW